MVPKVILLAEDNPDDAFIFQTMFKRARLPHLLHRVEDGQEAIVWLSGEGKYANRDQYPLPGLLLLDLKMPIKTGFEVMEWLRTQKQFKALPIVILSSSEETADVKRATELGAAKYFLKSTTFQDVIQYLS
ncbi:MAG: response regulator [Verrucomicrobiales bacterium]|nr:response regulator [Verrucomicrobiales bacterium]